MSRTFYGIAAAIAILSAVGVLGGTFLFYAEHYFNMHPRDKKEDKWEKH